MICTSESIIYTRIIIVFIIFVMAIWTESVKNKLTIRVLGLRKYLKAIIFNNLDQGVFSDSEKLLFGKYRRRLILFLSFMIFSFFISGYISFMCGKGS